MTRHLLVEEPGPLTTLQDEGRLGQAGIGVGRSGACAIQVPAKYLACGVGS